MKLGVLFSGGKDSCLALSKVMNEHEVVCLITLISKNKESFMFHVPNIGIAQLQSESIGIPIVKISTEGKKEYELEDLEKAIAEAKNKYGIECVVSGAVRSTYQASRIQKICKKLRLELANPLWTKDEIELLNEVVSSGIVAIISGVFGYPLGKEMLGKPINENMIKKLSMFKDKYKINPAGEGGELETTVLDAPFFKKRIKIVDYDIEYRDYSGVFKINKAVLADK